MRILGLDYGSKRIGVALSDELGITAQPLCTIHRKKREYIEEIAQIVAEYGVEEILVGYPVRLDGTEGPECERVLRFASVLESQIGIPVVTWNESLSTREAEEILSEAAVSPKKRKQVVDKLAAAIILQGYLDKKASRI